MLNKSIIDANKSVVKFFREHLPELGYDFIGNGGKNVILAHYDDGHEYTSTQIRLYRRPRGDKLLSVEGLTRRAKAGDVMTFQAETAVQRHWADRTETFHPRIIVRLELGEPPKEINLIE
jgi:hypothetical protein